MGAVVGGIVVVVVVVALVAVYVLTRLRRGPAPSTEAEAADAAPALADTDPVPREGGGMPLTTPPEDPAQTDAEGLDAKARREHDGSVERP